MKKKNRQKIILEDIDEYIQFIDILYNFVNTKDDTNNKTFIKGMKVLKKLRKRIKRGEIK